MKHQFDENSEVTNVKPVVDTGDFRAYPTEKITPAQGGEVLMQLCADLVGGRWEYWYTLCREVA